MIVAVCLKQTLARESALRVNETGTWIREDDATWALSEPDGYALEAALRLKDAHAADLIAVSAGPERVSSVLREALARGADRAIHVVSSHPAIDADPQAVADALAAPLAGERPDIILTGLQSDDHGFGQVGVALAERLGASHATIVVEIEAGPGSVRVKRELEAGWFQRITLPLPAVLTVQSGIHPLRYASLRGVMAAKKKEIRTIVATEPSTIRQRIVAVSVPQRSRQAQVLGGSPGEIAAALARLLCDTLK